MPTKEQLYQTWATEFQFPSTRREDDPLYQKPPTMPQDNPPLPADLQEQIRQEAANNWHPHSSEYQEADYIAGATAWAHWKVKYDALKEQADDLVKALLKVKEIAKRHGEIRDIINTAVATYQQPNKTITDGLDES